jgi:hypothetical protein
LGDHGERTTFGSDSGHGHAVHGAGGGLQRRIDAAAAPVGKHHAANAVAQPNHAAHTDSVEQHGAERVTGGHVDTDRPSDPDGVPNSDGVSDVNADPDRHADPPGDVFSRCPAVVSSGNDDAGAER